MTYRDEGIRLRPRYVHSETVRAFRHRHPVTDDTVVSANVLSPEEILAGMDAMGEKYRAQGGKLYSKASE